MKTTHGLFRTVACGAILFTLFFRPSPAKACSCVAGVTIQDNFATDEAVFTGKVIRIADNYAPIFSTVDLILYKLGYSLYFFDKFVHNDAGRLGFSIFFEVIDAWKGVKTLFIEVNTGRGGGDCGYSFTAGQEYLVYASHAYGIPDNYWVTGTCSRTAELTNAAEDMSFLTSKPSLSLKYSLPIFWTEQDSIVLALITLPIISIILLRRRYVQRTKAGHA